MDALKGWLSQWAWVLTLAVVILAAVVLPILKALTVLAWPWWAVFTPIYVLIALVVWALVGLNDMMRDGWH
jgi:hypothetical protein